MDNIGSEIGQKMRCAVKAKLIELGTGYIDDELPDYVMIMVANKRSKQQMIDDLNLFLGTNTLIFVNWLHEVLDKLQEVTLPSAPAKKRKESETVGKKDKKKDKKKKDGHEKETTPDLPSTAAPALPIITAGIKENYIQKAKQDLQIEASAKVKTKAEESEVPANGDDFDIPTITDIAKEAVDQKRHEKELQQLEELQKKIYIAKQQLRTMCSDESDEEDFAGTVENKTPEALPDTAKPAEQPSKTNRTGIHINPKFLERNEHIVPQKKQITMNNNNNNNNSKTTSVHDRLGQRKDETSDGALTPEDPNTQRRVIKLSAVRRAEREIYVPAFRRAEVEKQKVEQSERQRGRDRERDQRRHLDNSRGRIQIERQSGRPTRIDIRRSRERQRTPVQRRTLSRGNDRSRNRTRSRTRTPPAPPAPLIRRSISARSRSGERRTVTRNRVEISTEETETETIRKRIGSRVFVIPPKPPSEEGDIDMSVNSIIKIKPRAQVPESKQANKMLLLRAVAEAQKSTVAAKRKEMESTSRKYTQRRREPGTECILVEIPNDDGDEIDMNYEDIHIEEEDEYIPEPVTKTSESESDGVVYVPKKKSATKNLPQEEYDPNTIVTKENTQFVVTMENSTLAEEDKPKRPVKERIGFRMQIDENEEIKRRRKERFEQLYETVDDRAMSNSPSPSPPPVIKRIFNRHKKSRSNTPQYRNDSPRSPRRSRSPMGRKRSVDRKSDFWGDMKKEELPALRRHRARTISPINFELTDEETRSRSSHEMHSEIENNHGEDDLNEVKSKLKKLEPSRKFDNVPSLLSSVALADSVPKPKLKERCKYFPNCRDGSSCEFYHPSAPCMSFPNCKFGDKCLYLHPKCKFDQSCTRPECNFMHTVPIVISVKTSAPPLASSILPSQNYKPISVAPLPPLCKFFPNCSNTLCHFYHPKPCRFGKNCNNKIECNFYHQDLPTKDKLKWVSSMV